MNNPTSEQSLVAQIAGLLRDRGWKIEVEPRISSLIPDLVGEDPRHRRFVFEVKSGPGSGHLGALAQVESYRNALATQEGTKPEGVLVLVGDGSTDLDQAASESGIRILWVDNQPKEEDLDQLEVFREAESRDPAEVEWEALRRQLFEVTLMERKLAYRSAIRRTWIALIATVVAVLGSIAAIVALVVSPSPLNVSDLAGIALALGNLIVLSSLSFSLFNKRRHQNPQIADDMAKHGLP